MSSLVSLKKQNQSVTEIPHAESNIIRFLRVVFELSPHDRELLIACGYHGLPRDHAGKNLRALWRMESLSYVFHSWRTDRFYLSEIGEGVLQSIDMAIQHAEIPQLAGPALVLQFMQRS